MPSLSAILLRPLADTPRTRAYQAALDREVDTLLATADLDRGLLGTRGLALPHETVPDYWELADPARAAATPPAAAAAYAANSGRAGTALLCRAAFCWHSPLSQHHRAPALLRFFAAGLRCHLGSVRRDGLMGSFGLNGHIWAHGWDIEGLIYGLHFCGDALDPALLAHARATLARTAARHAGLLATPDALGTYGNQRAVYALGLYLYGQYLARADYVRDADTLFADVLPKVLDDSGQAVEQYGPCMHYSYTAFIYVWLNLALRGERAHDERVARCLEWFRWRHTESFYPLAGASARQYYETVPHSMSDLLPAAEALAPRAPALRAWFDRALAAANPGAPGDDLARYAHVSQHGASTLMWAMLVASAAEPAPAAATPPPAPVSRYYERTLLAKRSALKYVLVRRRYQTQVALTDWLPFSGLQTWALDDEPPILHPTPLCPSTTQAWGLDTARQGVSHNWGFYGAGLMAADACFSEAKAPGELCFLVARYDWLWRLVFFTDLSTVVLEFGRGGPRRTLWTLNRVAPAEPAIAPGVVRFAGRRACLHSSVAAPPTLVEIAATDKWSRGVRQLAYECGTEWAAFALSDNSFRFAPSQPLTDRVLRFADAAGEYEVTLHPGFLQADNPGNCGIDVWQLTYHGTTARRV